MLIQHNLLIPIGLFGLTAPRSLRIIPFVRKASVIPAAALAAGFIFALPSSSEGRSAAAVRPRRRADAIRRLTKNGPRGQRARRKRPESPQAPGRRSDRVAVQALEQYGPFLPLEVVRLSPSALQSRRRRPRSPRPRGRRGDARARGRSRTTMPEPTRRAAPPRGPDASGRSCGPSPPSPPCARRTWTFRSSCRPASRFRSRASTPAACGTPS